MTRTEDMVLIDTKQTAFFKMLFLLYPLPYRKRFENDMQLVFNDMYQEELREYGKIRTIFWLSQTVDFLKSITEQHDDFVKKYGFKKYTKNVLHLNKYNVLGIIFLLPFGSMFFIDFVSRIIQGDLSHPNPSVFHGLYNTPLYWFPILFTWVIFFPLMAAAVNIIPLVINFLKRSKHGLVEKNIMSIIILFAGLSVFALVKFHDFVPCFANNISTHGISHLIQIYFVCKNA